MKKMILIVFSAIALAACGFGPGAFSFLVSNEQCRTGRISRQEAFQSFKQLADNQNTPDALLMVARMYAQGIGTRRDIGKAKQYYEKAAQTPWRFNVEGYAKQELAELNSRGRLLRSRTVCPLSNEMGGLAF